MLSRNILSTALVAGLLSSCALFDSSHGGDTNHTWNADKNYGTKGEKDATQATLAYSQGRFDDAERLVNASLADNPRQPQALLVGALLYEQTGRINRAKTYYEDLILIGGDSMTVLGSPTGTPQKVTDIAKGRLRNLMIKQSNIVVEDQNGVKTFAISSEASQKQGMSAMEEALFIREQRLNASNRATAEADIKAVEVLFDEGEKNIISRFLILKELAEKDLITKEEFLNAREANIGGLLPLTHKPAAFGADNPVPSANLIIDRINALKEAVEARAITSKEFSAERNLIVEAILPPHSNKRLKPKAPAKDILGAAKDLRKIEVIYDLNLITTAEKNAEKKAVENYLGLTKEEPKAAPVIEKTVEKKIEALIEPTEGTPLIVNETVKEVSVIQPEDNIRDPLITNPF